jgi:hypothetical protein
LNELNELTRQFGWMGEDSFLFEIMLRQWIINHNSEVNQAELEEYVQQKVEDIRENNKQ